MSTHIECDACGIVLLAYESLGPSPIGSDECPKCGGAEFSFVD